MYHYKFVSPPPRIWLIDYHSSGSSSVSKLVLKNGFWQGWWFTLQTPIQWWRDGDSSQFWPIRHVQHALRRATAWQGPLPTQTSRLSHCACTLVARQPNSRMFRYKARRGGIFRIFPLNGINSCDHTHAAVTHWTTSVWAPPGSADIPSVRPDLLAPVGWIWDYLVQVRGCAWLKKNKAENR